MMNLRQTSQHRCHFREHADELEQHYADLIYDKIPEYVRFWEEFIGCRRTSGGLEPYEILPQSKAPKDLKETHMKVCLAHYSFLHNWLELHHHSLEVRELCSKPDIESFDWRKRHLRAFEICLFRLVNARNMIIQLHQLTDKSRDNRVERERPDSLTRLELLVKLRDRIVHRGILRVKLSNADGRSGLPVIEYMADTRTCKSSLSGGIPGWIQTAMFTETALNTLTIAFNESNRMRFEEFGGWLESKSLYMEWRTNHGQ